jgi:DEAD/DEAH box helicase domain-containing protein
MDTDSFFRDRGWEVAGVLEVAGRAARCLSCNDLELCAPCAKFIEQKYPDGIYAHQREAINAIKHQENLCLTTGTASGKSLVFYVAAIEALCKAPGTKILAIYPLKALGKEQETRWQEAFKLAGISAGVGRIDGQVQVSSRLDIVKNSDVLIMTPDVLHAWMMSNLNNRRILQFLSRLALIVLDEVHSYTGVFGSNSAFLFRRIQHAQKLLGKACQYICASATISNPEVHLEKLLGVNCKVLDSRYDTSPKGNLTVKLVRPSRAKDLLSNTSDFLTFASQDLSAHFIAFLDSRKQTEYLASIVTRGQQREHDEDLIDYDHLSKLNILPFRAGYEESDRAIIQDRLCNGTVSGIISTSALELGIDIPHLNLGVLVGVPYSATSFFQRIGRIGRKADGEIIVINRGDVYSENIFRKPQSVLELPLCESALYLENQRIQYIHALCLARQGGEHHQVCEQLK